MFCEKWFCVFSAAAALGLEPGTLLAVPNPSPPADEPALEAAVAQALAECNAEGVSGKGVTPFLLGRVTELTGGDSLASNVELVLNNSAVAAQVAVALSELRAGGKAPTQPTSQSDSAPAGGGAVSSAARLGAPVVIGGGTTDVTSSPKLGTPLIPATSSPGLVAQTMGGVGRCDSLVISDCGSTNFRLI